VSGVWATAGAALVLANPDYDLKGDTGSRCFIAWPRKAWWRTRVGRSIPARPRCDCTVDRFAQLRAAMGSVLPCP
jgi:hypothetical protein